MDKQTAEQTIHTLVEALPYIQRFAGCSIVVKYGGNAMGDEQLKSSFARDLVLMQQVGLRPVIIHGGGPQIGAHLKQLGKESQFVDGVRVTDTETMDVVKRVLGDIVNAEIVELIESHGGRATGITGKHGGWIRGKPLQIKKSAPEFQTSEMIDLGHTGTVASIDPQPILALEEAGQIPIIAPIGVGEDGTSYNINADTVASEVAIALAAEKLILLTNQAGVLDAKGTLMTGLELSDIDGLIADGTLTGGMLPKIRCVQNALGAGVHTAHIIDGRVAHAVLLEVFTREGIGTLIAAPAP